MRIGELADLVGVSTRTIRHYHHVGVLPEPSRASNGYREYGLVDAVLLVRARRLTELGLSLDDVADALADDRGRDLDEVLAELDADLGEREAQVRQQRRRVAELRARLAAPPASIPDVIDDPGLVAYDAAVRAAGAGGPAMDRDRALLSMISGDGAAELGALLGGIGSDPRAAARAVELYARLDALAGPTDPDPTVVEAVVEALATDILAAVPVELVTAARGQLGAVGAAQLALIGEGLSPHQRRVVEAVLRRLDDPSETGQ